MKKGIALLIMGVLITSITFAGGFDFHLGGGYYSSFKGDVPENVDAAIAKLSDMPLGVGAYVGVGYGFGNSQIFNLGAEVSMNWAMALDPFAVSKMGLQGRGYLKFQIINPLTITAFGGVQMNLPLGIGDSSMNEDVLVGNPVIGMRVAFLFLYAEYTAVMPDLTLTDIDFNISRHEVSIGWSVFK